MLMMLTGQEAPLEEARSDLCCVSATGQRRAHLLHAEVQEHHSSRVGPEARNQVHISGSSKNFSRLRTLQPERGNPDGESRLVPLKLMKTPNQEWNKRKNTIINCTNGVLEAQTVAGAEKGRSRKGQGCGFLTKLIRAGTHCVVLVRGGLEGGIRDLGGFLPEGLAGTVGGGGDQTSCCSQHRPLKPRLLLSPIGSDPQTQTHAEQSIRPEDERRD